MTRANTRIDFVGAEIYNGIIFRFVHTIGDVNCLALTNDVGCIENDIVDKFTCRSPSPVTFHLSFKTQTCDEKIITLLTTRA